ncbi:MAG: phosphatidate cytidylyltransferase [Alphaproteobacteria bacterium]
MVTWRYQVKVEALLRKEVALRVLSAVVMIPLALSSFYMGGVVFQCVVLALACVMALEWSSVASIQQQRPVGPLVFSVTLILALYSSQWDVGILSWPFILGFLLISSPPNRRFVMLMGFCYITVPAMGLISIRNVEGEGFLLLVNFFLIVWATDIGAYVGGKCIGGPRLWVRVSPHKTRSGALSGVISAMIISGIMYSVGYGFWTLLVWSPMIAIAAICGDLLESFFKRFYGQKDASTFIPGHGGVLDRVDGVVLAAPLMWLLVKIGAL